MVPGELELYLQAVAERARLRWPTVQVEQATFIAHATPHGPPAVTLEGWSAEELYLATALNAADPQALAVFEAEYLRPLDHVLARFSDPALADDAKQVLRERLLVRTPERPPQIGTFTGRGPLAKWLEVAVVRTAVSLRRRVRDQPHDDEQLAGLQAAGDDLRLVHLKETYLAEFTKAWRAALRDLAARDRTLLRLHVLDRLPFEQLGPLYGVHATTVGRWVGQVRDRLSHRVREILRTELRISTEELESIVGLIQSRMDVTLGALLSQEASPGAQPADK
ncbi:hypothetical protein BH11MYX2_BH11MYX2_11930 [soil metagenome]